MWFGVNLCCEQVSEPLDVWGGGNGSVCYMLSAEAYGSTQPKYVQSRCKEAKNNGEDHVTIQACSDC